MAAILFNRRFLALAIGLLLVVGIGALQTLPRLEDPRIVVRTATVLTFYPGADAERVEALVTRPIEDALRTLAAVALVESTSRAGVSVVQIELQSSLTDPAPHWSRVRDRLADVAPSLPAGAGTPELDDERGYAYTVVAAITWQAEAPPEDALLARMAEALADRLRSVAGVEHVRVHGAARERVEVVLDPAALAAAGLSVDRVAAALAQADARRAAGAVAGGTAAVAIELDGAFDGLDRLREVALLADGQATLRLRDIAAVTRGIADPPGQRALVDGQRAVAVGARMQPGQRVDLWVPRAVAAVEEFATELGDGLRVEVIFEQAGYTRARLGEVLESLALGLVLVGGVLLLTMGWRSALLVGLCIPLTALIALALFQPLGIEIHQMAVTGVIVALGLMVDNAIVMTNTIRDGMARGRSSIEAGLDAMRRLWAPLAASTITTILAFMPIVLLPAEAGEFVGPLALAVIAALIASYAVALFLAPALASLLPGGSDRQGWWARGLSWPWLTRGFAAALRLLLARPVLAVAIGLSLPVIGFAAMATIPQSFFPPADRDQFHLRVRLGPSASIQATERTVAAMDAIVRAEPGVTRAFWFMGASAPTMYYNVVGNEDANPAFAEAIINTSSIAATDRLIPRLQRILDAAFPQAETQVLKYEQGPPVNAPIELRLAGPDIATLVALGVELEAIMADTPGVSHARALVGGDAPVLRLAVSEGQARLAGLDLGQVADQLDAALAGRTGGFVLEGTERLPVLVRLPDALRADAARLAGAPLVLPDGRVMPLAAVAETRLEPGWSGIQRRNGERVQVLRGWLDAGVVGDVALARLRDRLDAAGFALPPGYRLETGGEAADRDDAVTQLLASVVILLVLMVATVAVTFNSFRATAIVFLAGVQTLGMGFLALKLTGYPFGFVIIVGIMGLVGVAINATIMILAAFREDPEAARGDVAAMVTTLTGPLSRHVWSTTITTAGGFIPLAISPGAFWPPFALTFIGGLLLATVIAFVTTPALWAMLAPRHAAPAGSAGQPLPERQLRLAAE
jgi:multidrug efflux pump subunit AcrB